MDSRQLGYFRQIIDSGSLTAAARQLGIAQPSLSQHVRNLEQYLATELLLRTARGVVPTEAGRVLYDYAVQVTDLMKSAEDAVHSTGSKPVGRVSFGMPASVSMALSIPLAESLRLEMPEVQFCAVEAMSGHIKDLIRSNEIDLALLYDVEELGECTSQLLLREDLWFYAASDDWPFDTPPGAPVALSRIADLDMVLPSKRHGLRILVDRVTRKVGIELKARIEMDSLQQIKGLVARGSGYTILSPAAVHDMVTTGALVGSRIIEPEIERPVYLARSTRHVTAASRATETYCLEVIHDLVRRDLWKAHLVES